MASSAADSKAVRFAGIARLYGEQGLAALRTSRVCVVGLGGVGSWSVEALARSGVGRLTLVDLDEVCLSNANRQLHTLTTTVGRSKASVLAERVRLISPDIEVEAIEDFFTESSAERILGTGFDAVIDAIDSFRSKCLLLAQCRDRGIPVVTVGGCGGRIDPSRVRLDDVSKSHGDALLAMVRKRLRQEFGFPRRGRWNVACVYSDEPQRFVDSAGEIKATRPENTATGMDCDGGLGAASFLTGTFGFLAAKAAIDLLVSDVPVRFSP